MTIDMQTGFEKTSTTCAVINFKPDWGDNSPGNRRCTNPRQSISDKCTMLINQTR